MRRISVTLLLLATLHAYAQSTVFITGSNRGIGLGLVQEYAAHGWKVIATCRHPQQAAELQALARKDKNIIIERLDVTDFARIDELARQYKDQAIDVLINNAGILPGEEWNKPFSDMNFDYAHKVFEVNSFAPVKIMQAFLPQIAASHQKKIINISSQAGSFANARHKPTRYVYRSSKAALNMFSFDIAPELGQQGIIVIALHPGVVASSREMSFEEMQKRFPGVITVKESAAKIYLTVANLVPGDNGKFLSYDGGKEMAW